MSRSYKDKGKTYKCRCSYCMSLNKRKLLKELAIKEIKNKEDN